jgi:hypothetical protein
MIFNIGIVLWSPFIVVRGMTSLLRYGLGRQKGMLQLPSDGIRVRVVMQHNNANAGTVCVSEIVPKSLSEWLRRVWLRGNGYGESNT